MKALPVLLLLSVTLVLSCDSRLESGGEEVEGPIESEYALALTRTTGQEYALFGGVETEWNLSSGIVVLGPEEAQEPEDTEEPLARLELHLQMNRSDPDFAIIERAILSVTARRTGTSEQIGAMLFTGGAPDGAVPDPECEGGFCDLCRIRSISSAHIITDITTDGPCRLEMERVSQGDGPEIVKVTAGFTATD